MLNERFIAQLQSFVRHPRLDAAADIGTRAVALLGFLLMLSGYLGLPTLPIFGHDEVHYYSSFDFKLVEDGRWLNYLLHDFLRSMALPLASLLYVALWWLLCFRVARACTVDAALAAMVASATLLSMPFLEIALWPASVLPALLLVWLALVMQTRGAAYQAIYLVCGVLMFGALQTAYFILPLLFLPQFLDSAQPTRQRMLLLFKHMLWWVAGSVAGVLMMCLMLWLLAGIWFPQPAPWRNTQPAVDAASLLANLRYVSSSFADQLEALLRLSGVTYGFILTCALIALLRGRALLTQIPAWLLLGAVLISFFVFSVPMAPVIHIRSLTAMAFVVMLFLALLPGRGPYGRLLAALLLLKLAQHSAVRTQQYLELHRAETEVFMSELRDLFPGYPMAYSRLALHGTMDPARPEARRFNDGSLMHPLMVSLGVVNFLDCRIPGRCDQVGPGGPALSVLPFAGGQLELSVDAVNNIGIVTYRDGTQPDAPSPPAAQ